MESEFHGHDPGIPRCSWFNRVSRGNGIQQQLIELAAETGDDFRLCLGEVFCFARVFAEVVQFGAGLDLGLRARHAPPLRPA